jgi:hypothetical protein
MRLLLLNYLCSRANVFHYKIARLQKVVKCDLELDHLISLLKELSHYPFCPIYGSIVSINSEISENISSLSLKPQLIGLTM